MNMDEIRNLLHHGEKASLKCKKAEKTIPKSVYETYSSFANTNSGAILPGVQENLKEQVPEKRFTVTGVAAPQKMIADFWNTINGSKVNANILVDEDVFAIGEDGRQVVVIRVPRTRVF